MQALLKLLQCRRHTKILEIGTAKFGSFLLFDRHLNPKVIVSVDLPGGEFGGGYPALLGKLVKRICLTETVHLVRADSHSIQTLAVVRQLVPEVDVLFIDGDHTYDGVAQDFYGYMSLVEKGGTIVLHDICKCLDHRNQVPIFWQELKSKFTCVEIASGSAQGFGVGCIYV